MKNKIIASLALIAVLLFTTSASVPKGARQKIVQGDTYFAQDDYTDALKPYLEAFKLDPSNANLCFKIGVCCLNISTERQNAEKYLFIASNDVSEDYHETSIKERHAPVMAYYYYGQSLHLANKFDDAIASFEKYKGYIDPTDSKTLDDVNLRITWCRNGKILVADPVNIKVENVGPGVNSQYPEYSAVISADEKTLSFTARRPNTTGGQIDPRDNMYFEDIYISTKNADGSWGQAVPMGNNINTNGHEATIGLSADGQKLLIYKDDAGDGNIYISQLNGNNWGPPQKLTENINSKSHEPSACITPDGSTLYFTSNMPGGFGGEDIYRSVRLPNGEWSKGTNLGPKINSKYDEDAPAILADGLTLYFASNGEKSMGGFDILSTVFNPDSGWSTPVNIGYPVNSSADDLFFVPTPDDKHAYYSSANSPNGFGDKDICFLTFPEKEESKLTVLEGEILSIYGGIPENTVITVTDVATGEIMGNYVPNSVTGHYVIVLPPGRNYSITYEATDYLFQSDNVNIADSMAYQVIDRPVELEPLKVGQKLVVRNIFFPSGKSVLADESKTELDKLVDLMTKHPLLVVEISGHTDASGSDELNQKLSEKRALAVADYLVAHGVDRTRLRTIGYGESKPIAKNYNADGSPNKQGMSLNRRFEFTILSVDGKIKDIVEPIKVPDNLKDKGGK
jgi:outer membrane protein OmpA-like peptidoglycan-associated protein/tetratricopeptide (TPR) repeat protein